MTKQKRNNTITVYFIFGRLAKKETGQNTPNKHNATDHCLG